MDTTADILRKALELLGPNGERWTKHASALDADGVGVSPTADSAERFCSLGALYRVTHRDVPFDRYHAADLAHLSAVTALECGTADTLTFFNDRPDTTFADVVEVFEHAIQKASQP
jgi:hypothetical protein